MSFTVGKLLAFALAVEQQPTKLISKDEAIQFCNNTLGSTEVLETPNSYS